MSLISTITTAVTGWKAYLIVGVLSVAAAAGVYEYIYHKGETAQSAVQATAQLKATVKGETVHGQLEQKVIKLADPDLDGQLDRWMRD